MKNLATCTAAIIAISLLFLTACGQPELTEKEKFIEANAELTCEILKDPSLTIDMMKRQEMAKEIFSKHELPVENDEAMLALLNKYENDTEVEAAVQEKVDVGCR